jgi:PleD family two-component response regulator
MGVVLIVCADAQLLEPVAGELEAGGYAVLRAPSGQAALAAVRRTAPDAIVVAAELPDAEPAELCRLLRRAPRVTPHTAIFLAGDLASRDARLAALRAGASDIFGQPLDIAELLLKLDTYAQLKTLAEQMQSGSLVDQETGLYNLQGLARRVEELGALSVRAHGSLACVVLAPELDDEGALPEVSAFCAQTIKGGVRHSDVPGRIAAAEFAVVAPRTGANGAIRLAQRLADVMRRRSHDAGGAVPAFRLRAGYDAVGNLAYAPVSASDLLVRARRAWQGADAESRLGWIRAYEA